MAVNSGIFNSVAGDRKYDASWFADYFASFIGNGVFPNPSNGLQVMEHSNMQTVIKPGKGWINGYYVTNTEDYVVQHEVAGSSLSRIDRIVLQKSTADRAINIVLKKGTFASTPVPPLIVRDADYYELVLADILINAGTTKIIQGNITDQRLNNSLCGIVHAVVEQVDTTSIFNQYQSWFNNHSVTKAQEFESWKIQTQQVLNDWIQNEQTDFESWRISQEELFNTWYSQHQLLFDTWFNDIKAQLATVDIGDHLLEEMPHRFMNNGKLYKWGMGVENSIPYLIVEEVI